MPTIIGFAGLTYDVGMLFAAKREAYTVASAAARAGANDIDTHSLYISQPILARTAPGTASAYAQAQGLGVPRVRLISDTEIEITVRQDVQMLFLGLVGVGGKVVEATATAEMSEG